MAKTATKHGRSAKKNGVYKVGFADYNTYVNTTNVEPAPKWAFRPLSKVKPNSLTIEVIADYGGGHAPDHAFNEVHHHFRRFDSKGYIKEIVAHPVYAFSTIETGFWISQMAQHSEHENLVIFSNTAPRGDIEWGGEMRQPFVYALLDNNVPVFAVHAGYNLSFIKDRIKGIWEVDVTNSGTQFRSRDQYPEATLTILMLHGKKAMIGKPVSIREIPSVPSFRVASVDGYGNLKTSIRRSEIPQHLKTKKILRVTIADRSHFLLNSLAGIQGKVGDLQMVVGSSGGKRNPFIEFVALQERAADYFSVKGPRDDMPKIVIEGV